MTKSSPLIAGVCFSHNAGVAMASPDGVEFALQEERVTRTKNHTGFPSQAYLEMLRSVAGGDPSKIDLVVFPTAEMQEFHFFIDSGDFSDGRYFQTYTEHARNEIPEWFLDRDRDYIDRWINADLDRISRLNSDPLLRDRALSYYEERLGVGRDSFRFLRHHAAHAYSACLGITDHEDTLVFTLDGSGDSESSTVNRYGPGGLRLLSSNGRYVSLGLLYREVTAFLGMKPDEHEAKVMGLAAYARPDHYRRTLDEFSELISLNEAGEFESDFPMHFARYFLLEKLVYHRFDAVAAAVQAYLEDQVARWVTYWMRTTGLRRIALSGGVFMNVKLNQRVAELPEVDECYVVPSAGDESLPFGACFYGVEQLTGRRAAPLASLGLGPRYSDDDVARVLERELGDADGYVVRKVHDPVEEAATLIAGGEVIAWFNGRAEWGARALGHRSILCHPADRGNVEYINELVKGRDFWMPFAPSVLDEEWSTYIRDIPHVNKDYMSVTFEVTERGRTELAAAMHHGDGTLRPQRVRQTWQPVYHRLIRAFQARTGIGAVLNTSMNLHGEPMALAPPDAIRVLTQSGLRHLVIENWLVSKKS